MNFLKHRQRSQCHVLPMPEGLQELMSDISREVLRCQPSVDCTYKFIADYLDAMIATREKSRIAMEIIEEAILNTDEIYSQFVKCNIPKDRTDNFMHVLEMTFRRFVEQKRRMNQDPRYITFQADDLLDELLRKCDMTKVEILRSRPAIQWAYKNFVESYIAAIEGTFDVADLYHNTNKLIISCREQMNLEKSALTIQKTYRGFFARKHKLELAQHYWSIKSKAKQEKEHPHTSIKRRLRGRKAGEQEGDPYERSAITIQKRYRYYREHHPHDVPVKSGYVDSDDSVEEFKKYARKGDINKAAVMIQSHYKGFHTRKLIKDHAI